MRKDYNVIIRKSEFSYIALCLELNICSTGNTLEEVEQNLNDAINIYLEDINQNPGTEVNPISINDFIEFLKDTKPNIKELSKKGKFFNSFEISETPVYA